MYAVLLLALAVGGGWALRLTVYKLQGRSNASFVVSSLHLELHSLL